MSKLSATSSTQQYPGAGFTLLEVLIAMLVVGIGLLALATTASHQLRQQDELRQQILAHWVAQNAIAEFRLATRRQPGTRTGESRLGQRDWYWQLHASPASDPALLRLEVAVYNDPQQRQLVAAETGFSLPGSGR